jgi:branched-chain amino acid aminotransferase
MKIMRLESSKEVQQLGEKTVALLKKNGLREDCHIRQTVFLNCLQHYAGLMATGPVGTLVTPYPRGRSFPEEGIHCCVSSWQRISDNTVPPRAKCGANYQSTRLALLQAQVDGYDGTILLNEAGKVSEAPGACFFMVRDGVPITPPVTSKYPGEHYPGYPDPVVSKSSQCQRSELETLIGRSFI